MIKILFIDKTNNTYVQLFRSVFVGGVSFICDFSTLFTLTECFKIYYLISAAIAFILGLAINYYLSIKWIFEKRSVKSKHLEFTVFALIGVTGLALNEIFMWFFTDMVNIHYLFSKLISAGLLFLAKFFARKFLLFN